MSREAGLTFSPSRSLIGLATLAPDLAFAARFTGPLAFVPAFAAFVALAAGLRAPLARDARLTFGFAMLSVIIRPFLFDVSQVAPGVHPRTAHSSPSSPVRASFYT